ncbi:flagellar basal body rod protein FlgC [Pontibacillus chungwhensis BH030062]|uniref:Flagellar basal body rod protein FlgC n=1 Tax=Pontibacillus chungwhensis BH030062 TaxID=1385513 RepID=A0A0A2UWZ2_9BACI|nr:flagellar hook-basal body protein [Pontibacillus chungwhensis]KGP92429.1 flagellar basal body rod protein FlgC [Pontibacillus chungwhensis BH030062]
MLRGFYSAASGMIAQQRQQEALSNNLANSTTPGYKADQSTMRAFPELLMQKMGSKEIPTQSGGLNLPMNQDIGSMNTGVYVQEEIPNFAQGDIRETGILSDMALVNGNLPDETGALFFTVQGADGEQRYTRNGNFTVDGQGFLTTQSGNYVLDSNSNRIQTGGMDFNVTEDGVLEAGGQATPLGITYTEDMNQMVKDGGNLFRFEGEEGQVVQNARTTNGVTFSIQQNFLERSNVDTSQTMVEMMNSYRLFETNQKVLKAYDQSMDKAVNEIARVR